MNLLRLPRRLKKTAMNTSPQVFSSLTLDTERLILRPLANDDANDLLEVFSDPRVMRYWSTGPWQDISEAQELIDRDLKAMATSDYLRLALVLKDKQKLIGHCSIFNISQQSRRAELGYGMGYDSWGQGYMHEALSRVVAFAFDELGLNRLEADIDPRNLHSQRSLERLGFQQEGFLRERWIVGDEVSDTALFGLLCREWRAKHAAVRGLEKP